LRTTACADAPIRISGIFSDINLATTWISGNKVIKLEISKLFYIPLDNNFSGIWKIIGGR